MVSSEKYDEQKLSMQLQSGSMIAFESVYNHYKGILYYFALSYIGRKEDAEEIIQNTFISLWEHRSTINPSLPLKSYLYKITTNLVYNYLKRNTLHNKFIQHTISVAIDEDDSTQKELYYRDLRNAVDRIIGDMPEQQKLIFKLSRWEGLSHEEIANRLKISVRTVENQVYRAIRLLKENLKDEFLLIMLLLNYFTHLQ